MVLIIDIAEFKWINKKEVFDGENDATTTNQKRKKVYYKHLPKKFVPDTVYDPVEKEVVIGGICTLVDVNSNDTYSVETNNFGDFWFRGLEDNRAYILTLEKNYKYMIINNISMNNNLSLGDIAF